MELTLLSEHVEPATAVSMGMPGAAPGGTRRQHRARPPPHEPATGKRGAQQKDGDAGATTKGPRRLAGAGAAGFEGAPEAEESEGHGARSRRLLGRL